MAIRRIRYIGDDILKKKCKPVTKMTDATKELIGDLFDTMYEARGVGLAAPQVGILRRICVVDVMDDDPIVLINPEVVESSGEQTDDEGCLRPEYVKVSSLDMDMNPVTYEGEGLRARAMLHEMDHLDGILYGERANEPYRDLEEEEEWEEE